MQKGTYTFYADLSCFPNMDAEIELVAEFDASPEEAKTFDDPGSDAEVVITAIRANSITGGELEEAVAAWYNKQIQTMDFSHLEEAILCDISGK